MKRKNLVKLNCMRLVVWGMLPAWMFGSLFSPALWFNGFGLLALLSVATPVAFVALARKHRAAARIAFAEMVWVFKGLFGLEE